MSGINLMAASHQWANRPADERFSSLADLRTFTEGVKARAVAAKRPFAELRAEALDGDVLLSPGVERLRCTRDLNHEGDHSTRNSDGPVHWPGDRS